MSTEKFLALLPEFEEHGIDLFQMSKRVPNTLRFRTDIAMNPILIQNGLFLTFTLPHANEVAQLSSPSKSYLENLLKVPAIRDLAP